MNNDPNMTPSFEREDSVIVAEPNTRPWRGEVRSIKWSHASGWWVEIERAGDPALTYSVWAEHVKPVELHFPGCPPIRGVGPVIEGIEAEEVVE